MQTGSILSSITTLYCRNNWAFYTDGLPSPLKVSAFLCVICWVTQQLVWWPLLIWFWRCNTKSSVAANGSAGHHNFSCEESLAGMVFTPFYFLNVDHDFNTRLYLVVIEIDKKLGVYDLLETWCLVILQKYRLAKYSPDISDGMRIIFLSDTLLSSITSQ